MTEELHELLNEIQNYRKCIYHSQHARITREIDRRLKKLDKIKEYWYSKHDNIYQMTFGLKELLEDE